MTQQFFGISDLCVQCAREEGKTCRSHDLAGLVSRSQFAEGLVAKAECSGCGITYVNHKGECISKCCSKAHGDN